MTATFNISKRSENKLLRTLIKNNVRVLNRDTGDFLNVNEVVSKLDRNNPKHLQLMVDLYDEYEG